MTRYWIYFRGTRNGQYIEAATLKAAKDAFAAQHGLSSLAYVAARRA